MGKRKLYLDTCVILAFYYPKDRYHKKARKFFKKIAKTDDSILVLSDFVITEFTWVYIIKPGVIPSEVFKTISDMNQLKKIGNKYSFELIETEGNEKGYDFPTFFVDIRDIILDTKPRQGIADTIHTVIMKNNKIKDIVTFNKDDFKNVEGINAIGPEDKKLIRLPAKVKKMSPENFERMLKEKLKNKK